jgi:glutathione reductase (NADPH)
METFDLVVIGAGAAGPPPPGPRRARARCALADRGPLGGLCVNRGCIPKTALVAAGRVHRQVREAGGFGTFSGPVRLDWDAVQQRQDEIVNAHLPSAADLEKRGIRVRSARSASPNLIEVNGRLLGAGAVIAAGSQPVIPERRAASCSSPPTSSSS